jgi:prepilin peptidase CpaA
MVGTALLGVFLLIATYTDMRWRIIHNTTAYTGIVAAWMASGWASWAGVDSASAPPRVAAWYGLVSLPDSLLGTLACGALMLVAYVCFASEVGGGDVKLLAMIGGFLGPYDGLEAMLWTMVIAGVLAVVVLVWRVGTWRLVGLLGRHLMAAARGIRPALSDDERVALRSELFLSPSALLAVVVVRFGWVGG